MELLTNLEINISFAEAREKMHAYAKFMKKLISKKRKLPKKNIYIALTKRCNAIFQRMLPLKKNGP